MNLNEAKVLITGGSRGIGYATAKLLIAGGAQVVIAARNKERVTKAAEELGGTGIVCDVADEASVEAMVAKANEAMGGLNVLLNNAAVGYFAPMDEIDTQRFEDLFRINVTGAMMVGRACARVFKAQKRGDIINVSSTAGKRGYAGGTAYAASKFAIGGMTECWRAELRPFNIRVSQIHPSEVQTTFNRDADAKIGSNESKLNSYDIAKGVEALITQPDHGFITDLTIWATNPQS